jgi:hypothetical protein
MEEGQQMVAVQLFRLTITMMVTKMPTMTEKNAMPTA